MQAAESIIQNIESCMQDPELIIQYVKHGMPPEIHVNFNYERAATRPPRHPSCPPPPRHGGLLPVPSEADGPSDAVSASARGRLHGHRGTSGVGRRA